MMDIQIKVVVTFACGRDVFAVLPYRIQQRFSYACLSGVFDLVICPDSLSIVCIVTPVSNT